MAATKKPQDGKNNPRFKHGMSRIDNPTYKVWVQLRRRCREREDYIRLGVCDRWSKDFMSFFEDMGPKPDGFVLDRINNDLGYSPDNCRWTTPKVNANNRRNTVKVTLNGTTKTAAEWAEETGIQRQTICWRVRQGWLPEEILQA